MRVRPSIYLFISDRRSVHPFVHDSQSVEGLEDEESLYQRERGRNRFALLTALLSAAAAASVSHGPRGTFRPIPLVH